MTPITRIVFPIIGALIGASLGTPSTHLFDVLLGAIAGFLIADLGVLRTQLDALSAQVGRLAAELRRGHAVSPEPARLSESIPAQSQPDESPDSPNSPETPVPATSRPLTPSGLAWHQLEEAAIPAEKESHDHARASLPSAQEAEPELPIVTVIRDFFTGGNAVVRVGVIVLFFGVAFLLRYMAEHTHLPIEVRLSGVTLAGLALLIFGWRLRSTRAGYALAIQGGAVGILYLTVFAALRLYAVLPAAIAFPILSLVALLSAVLAVLQNSMAFALLAVCGGFLAPILASTGQGSHVVLFNYYAVLNAGILAVAWFKAWRPLNIAGFVFTFAIGTAWGVFKYRPEDFPTTEPFLILFFLFYLGISILFTLRQPAKLTGYIDGTLIFGTPIVVFGLQSGMLHERLMSLAYSALAMSALYLSIAWILKYRRDDSQKLMREAFMALGIVFLTLAVPLALDARWNAASWALEGAALVWVGCRQNRLLPRVFGALLSVAAGFVVATHFDDTLVHATVPLGIYFAILLQSAASIFSARTLNAGRPQLEIFEQFVPDALYCWGAWWWFIGSVSEVFHYTPTHAMAGALILTTVTTLVSSEIHRRTQLGAAKVLALLQLPAMFIFAVHAAITLQHPSVDGGWLSWPLAFLGLCCVNYRHEGEARAPLANVLNSLSTWLLCALLSWEAAWAVDTAVGGSNSWPLAAWVVVPTVFLFWLPRLVTRVKWPFAKNRDASLFITGVGVTFYLGAWSLISNAMSVGDTAPLSYIPVLNPLDLAQAFVLLVLFRYWRFLHAVRSTGFWRIDPRVPMPALAALAFIWLNAVLLRTLHQWFAIPFGFDPFMQSTLVQSSLSIFWTLLALAAMLVATRKRFRTAWLVGAALMAVVIAKLFLVDLSRTGSVERIVSFLGVGLLMLIVGYFSPLPPAKESKS
jgi:uncharacterized membrane protein